MASDKIIALLKEAKMLYDHGVFGPLHQAEFFKAVEEDLGEYLNPGQGPTVIPVPPPMVIPLTPEQMYVPPPPAPTLPEIGATLQVAESSDRKV